MQIDNFERPSCSNDDHFQDFRSPILVSQGIFLSKCRRKHYARNSYLIACVGIMHPWQKNEGE